MTVPTAAEVLSFIDYFAGQEDTAEDVRDFVQKAARAIEEIWTFDEWMNEPELASVVHWLQEREP